MLLKMSFNTSEQPSPEIPATQVQEWEVVLQQAGNRLTRPRRAVLEVVATAEAALTASQIYHLARRSHPRVGLVTVYRTLDLLIELGWVHRLPSSERSQVYARNDLSSPTHLLVCQSCHRAVGFPCHCLPALVTEVEQQTGFAVRQHSLELLGLCPACQEGGRHGEEEGPDG